MFLHTKASLVNMRINGIIQVKLEKFECGAKVNFSKSTYKVKLLYRLITCKVRYFKPVFVIILMIMAAYENPNIKIRIL